MNKLYNEITDSYRWNTIQLINKGWSNDKKYYIEINKGRHLLLRVSDISQYKNKKRDYEVIKKLDEIDILMSRPIDFGICNNGKKVYTLFTWIDGKDAEVILPTLTDREQYNLGFKAGEVLRKMHQIPSPENQIPWAERFNYKINRNIKAYEACGIKFQDADKIINYIDKNRQLLENRQQSFQHGDYHVGNMIVTEHGEIGIIDFNRLDFGDPWEEFNRVTWCADISKLFASGRINGYFDGDVPDSFFRLLDGTGRQINITRSCSIILLVCMQVLMMLMSMLVFFAGVMVMFVAMCIGRMYMLMVVHFPIMHMRVFMTDF